MVGSNFKQLKHTDTIMFITYICFIVSSYQLLRWIFSLHSWFDTRENLTTLQIFGDVQLALSYCFYGFILTVQQLYSWVVGNQNIFKMYLILTKYCNWSFSQIQAVWLSPWSDFSILNWTEYCGFLFTWEHLFSPFADKMQERIAQEVCIQDFTVLSNIKNPSYREVDWWWN